MSCWCHRHDADTPPKHPILLNKTPSDGAMALAKLNRPILLKYVTAVRG